MKNKLIISITIFGFLIFSFLLFRIAFAAYGDMDGWIWSDNLGWISLNCQTGGPSQEDICSTSSYKINIDPSTNELSGQAWSDNGGWLSFERSETGAPPGPPFNGTESYIAKRDPSTERIKGWAKFLVDGGGWDGWVSLNCEDTTDNCASSNYNVHTDGSDIKGYAWGSDVCGWIQFDPVFGGATWEANTPLNDPTSLVQKKTDDTVLNVGDWIKETSVKFTASLSDPDPSDTLYLCVEADKLGTAFSNTEDACGSGVSYSGTPVTGTVTLSSLTEGEYHWQARVKDAASSYSNWVSYGGNPESERDFGIDISPPGGGIILPPVSTVGQGNISQSLGGQVSRTFESGKMAKVVFPAQSIKGTVVVKIEPQNKTEIIKTNPLPKNTQIIGDLVADFKALSGGKEIESFEKEATITFTYTDSQTKEAEIDEETLKIYWWDKTTSSWEALISEVNTATNTVTAFAPHFALFSVIGESIEEKPVDEIIEEVPVVVYEGIPAGFTFEKNLKYDDKNDDVKYLQIILKTETPETYPADAPATGWFGPITKASVIAFQEKYASDILALWELTEGTGYVGKTTRAKLNSLLSVVPTEEKEVVPEILEIPAGYKFTKYLWYGQKDEEVRYLQIFLKSQGPEIYPEGLVTGYFKSLTEAAVKRFQIKYGIVSSEDDYGAGYVGPKTRAKINEILGW